MLIREDLPQMLPGDNSLIQSPRREQPCYKKTINLIFLCYWHTLGSNRFRLVSQVTFNIIHQINEFSRLCFNIFGRVS